MSVQVKHYPNTGRQDIHKSKTIDWLHAWMPRLLGYFVMPFSALQVASQGDSWWVENPQMFCPSSWNTGVMLGRSRKVQACQCREG